MAILNFFGDGQLSGPARSDSERKARRLRQGMQTGGGPSPFLTWEVNWAAAPGAVIFDLDGTLYSTLKMRLCMIGEMLRTALAAPDKMRDLQIVWNYRQIRQQPVALTNEDLTKHHYQRTAQVSGVSPQKVNQAVNEWLHDRPLPYLRRCRYGEVAGLFSRLRHKGIRLGVFSDYPATAKLKALGLAADVVVAATDREVNHLKPHPAGLYLAAGRLETPRRSCLFIGDQDDKDGECARRADMPYIVLAPGNRARQFKLLETCVQTWTR